MHYVYEWLFPVVWIVFLAYWQIAAIGAKKTQRIESVTSRVLRTVVFLAGVVLVSWAGVPGAWLYRRLLPMTAEDFWIGAGVMIAGLLFCIWARLTLGRNWSRSVTIKEGHELITGGPYGLVRHPIYTGLLTAFVGTAIAIGQVRGLVALVLIFASLWYKLSLEEKWMRGQFGDSYLRYQQQTKALVPWVL
jgi:protein-S-isoprenylcysteine O-methyltransferase Ste14